MKCVEVFLIALAVCRTVGRKKIARVAGGESDCAERFPYVGAFIARKYDQFKNVRYCTGSVIAPEWVLTAGHCLPDSIIRELHFAYGDLLTELRKSSLIKVLSAVTSYYDQLGPGLRNDIGLAMVEPIKLGTYGKISALDCNSLIGYAAEYVGAGSTFTEAPSSNKKLYRKKLKRDQTRRLQIGKGVIAKCENYDHVPSICLRPKCGVNRRLVQFGDPGGPMIYNGKIIAVAASLDTETIDVTPTKFTPVSPYLDWIRDTTAKTKDVNA